MELKVRFSVLVVAQKLSVHPAAWLLEGRTRAGILHKKPQFPPTAIKAVSIRSSSGSGQTHLIWCMRISAVARCCASVISLPTWTTGQAPICCDSTRVLAQHEMRLPCGRPRVSSDRWLASFRYGEIRMGIVVRNGQDAGGGERQAADGRFSLRPVSGLSRVRRTGCSSRKYQRLGR